jgi:hypothetical protein
MAENQADWPLYWPNQHQPGLSEVRSGRAHGETEGRHMKYPVFLIILTLTVVPMSFAQDDAPADAAPQTFPCEDREEFKFNQFDFWLGEWDVHVADGSFAGSNRIEKSQHGCVLLENWVSTNGIPGASMNYFDVATKEWVQVWTGAGGTQIDIRGGLTEEGMLLKGQINYVGNGTSAPFRGLWTQLPDGRVRQFFEQSNDGGETWAPWFEGFYTRTNTEAEASVN